jgi:hypothetical protein
MSSTNTRTTTPPSQRLELESTVKIVAPSNQLYRFDAYADKFVNIPGQDGSLYLGKGEIVKVKRMRLKSTTVSS